MKFVLMRLRYDDGSTKKLSFFKNVFKRDESSRLVFAWNEVQ